MNFAVESKRFTRFTHANTKTERERGRKREVEREINTLYVKY